MILTILLACSPDVKEEMELQFSNPFEGELLIDLQPNEWPNILLDEPDILVALLSRNGIAPSSFALEDVALWDSEGINSVPALEDIAAEDIDGDGLPDRILRFDRASLVEAEILKESGRIELRVDDLSATDLYTNTSRPTFTFPQPLGGYPVATVQYEWDDTQRVDEITVSLPHRKLAIQIWYPGDVPDNAQPTEHYLNREEGISLATGWGIFPKYYDYLYSYSHYRAPMSADQAQWPVLIFSHGYGVQLSNQSVLVQNAASHGFIVVGVQHTYSTPVTIFQDGTTVNTYLNAAENTEDIQNMWTEDLRFVIDKITELSTTSALFTNRIDLDKIGVFGYSFGGSTAAELCRTDSRVLAGINIDGTFYGDTESGFDQDFFLFNASLNFQDGSREPLLNSVRGQAYNLTISEARHSNFDDFALQEEYIRELLGGGNPGLGLGTINPEQAYEIVNQYTAAFFQQHVIGIDASLLQEESPFAEAEYHIWNSPE